MGHVSNKHKVDVYLHDFTRVRAKQITLNSHYSKLKNRRAVKVMEIS